MASSDFTDQASLINGASDLIVAVFGDRGRHARAAVGINSLPFVVAVEVDAIFELVWGYGPLRFGATDRPAEKPLAPDSGYSASSCSCKFVV